MMNETRKIAASFRIHHSAFRIHHFRCWWVLTGSNRRHSPCKGDALPAELSTRYAARQLTTFRRPKYFGVDAVARIYPKLDRFGLLPGG